MNGPAATRRSLVTAFVVAFAVRIALGAVVNGHSGAQRGFSFYGTMADNVLCGRGLVWNFYEGLGEKWANRGPLYPLFLAGVRWVAGGESVLPVVIAQAAVGALACAVPVALALRWGGARAAVVAAWVAALWPYSVVADTGLVEHVVYALFAGLAVLFALRAADGGSPVRGLAAGLFAGLATLSRVTFAVSVPILALAAMRRRPRLRVAAFVCAGVAVVLLPWVARNHAVTGAWVMGSDAGRALWVGNSEGTFRRYPAESIDKAEVEMLRALPSGEMRALKATVGDEIAQDRLFREMALATIAERPAETAWGGLRKAAALWSPVLNPGPVAAWKLAVFGASAVLLFGSVLAAAVVVPRLRADIPVCLGVAMSFTAVSALFWGQPRYLAPLHGVGIAMLAAFVAARLGRRSAAA